MVLAEGARQSLLQRLVGRRRADGLELVDDQHHGLRVARVDDHVQRRAPRHADSAVRSVQHVGAVLDHVLQHPGLASRACPVQGRQATFQPGVEVGVGRSQQLRGEGPAGGFDHLLGFPIVTYGVELCWGEGVYASVREMHAPHSTRCGHSRERGQCRLCCDCLVDSRDPRAKFFDEI